MGLMDWLCGCGGKRVKPPKQQGAVPVDYAYKAVPQNANMGTGSNASSPLGIPVTPPPMEAKPVLFEDLAPSARDKYRAPTPPRTQVANVTHDDDPDELVYAEAKEQGATTNNSSCTIS